MFRHLLVGFVVTIVVFIHPCSGCTPLDSWREQTFLERASQADIIVNGVVTNLYPIPEHPTSFPEQYLAEFEIGCIVRATEQIPAITNVTGFGTYSGLCTATLVEEGSDYILFLRDDDGQLAQDDINIQSSAVLATDEILGETATLCYIDLRSPEGSERQCPAVLVRDDDTEKCYSGSRSYHDFAVTIFILFVVYFSQTL